MAAATTPLMSTLMGDATRWVAHTPDYHGATGLLSVFGEGSGSNNAQCKTALVGMTSRTPTVIAAMLDNDNDNVYVLHSPTLIPADPVNPGVYGSQILTLLGDNIQTALPIVLNTNAFTRTAGIRALVAAEMRGAAGYGANPAVVRFGPHGATAANVEEIQARKTFVLDPAIAVRALTTQPSGMYNLRHFYATFISADAESGDNARVAAIEPLLNWFRLASTDTAGGHSVLDLKRITGAPPLQEQVLMGFMTSYKNNFQAQLGLGGPGLTSVAFTAGIDRIENAVTTTNAAHIAYLRDAGKKTFTERYGASIAQLMYNVCNVADDDHLPEIHRLMASSPKGRAYAILAAELQTRAQSCNLPLVVGCLPMATTKLVDDVYRNFRPAGTTGLTYGEGLSPFSCICENHTEAANARKLLQKAAYAESGTGVTLEDAEIITSSNVLFPTSVQTCVEKLYAWSVNIDLFHGNTHPVATNTRIYLY